MLHLVIPNGYRRPEERHAVPAIIRPVFECLDEGRPIIPTVREVANGLGFDSFSCSYSNSPRLDSGHSRVLFTTLPKEWIERYNAAGYAEIDVRLHGVVDSALPMLWDSKSLHGRNEALDELLDQLGAQGLRSGIAYGFHDRSQGAIVATMNSAKSSLAAGRRDFIEQNLGDIVLFAKAFHQFVMAPLIEEMRPRFAACERLTPREREVYELVAEGLDTEMISARLGISKSTVQRHIDGGRSKTGANNRLQALVIALKDGQIVSGRPLRIPSAQAGHAPQA